MCKIAYKPCKNASCRKDFRLSSGQGADQPRKLPKIRGKRNKKNQSKTQKDKKITRNPQFS